MATSSQTLTKASYFRSQMYTAYLGVNPLIAAAHPLFSLIERINLSRQIQINDTVHQTLEHELRAFETRASDAHYDTETILISRYLISTVLQESIEVHNADFHLLPPSKDNISGSERFFEVINRIIDKPEMYLDLLELIYFCLSTGYRGKYLQNKEKLALLKDELYQIITKTRLFPPQKEMIKATIKPTERAPMNPTSNRKLLACGLLIVATVFVSGGLIINQVAKKHLNLNFSDHPSQQTWKK